MNKRRNNIKCIDEYKDSVLPAKDYLFAKEFNGPSDNRYKLIKTFENIIWEQKQLKMYNCKITMMEHVDNHYNVYVYFYDVEKTLGNEYDSHFNNGEDYTALFHQALKVCPINELQGKKLNSNGVFVKDFLV